MSWKGTRWSGSARKGTRRQEPGWLTAARSQPPHPRATAAARPRQSGRPTPQPPCRGYDTLRNPPPRSQSCPRAGDRGVSCILAGRMGAGGASEYSRPRLGPGWTRRTVPPTCVGRRCPRPATSTVAAAAGRCGRRAAARLAEDPGGPCWPRRGGGAGHEGRGAVPRGGGRAPCGIGMCCGRPGTRQRRHGGAVVLGGADATPPTLHERIYAYSTRQDPSCCCL